MFKPLSESNTGKPKYRIQIKIFSSRQFYKTRDLNRHERWSFDEDFGVFHLRKYQMSVSQKSIFLIMFEFMTFFQRFIFFNSFTA
jgi:hypothetical protein